MNHPVTSEELHDVVSAQACLVHATRISVGQADGSVGLEHFGEQVDPWEQALVAYDTEPGPGTWRALVTASRRVLDRDIAVLKEQISILQAWSEHAEGQTLARGC